MDYLFTFVFCFLVIYLLYLLFIVLRKKGLEKFKTSKQLEYFKIKFNLDMNKINFKKFANTISLTNAFMIASVVTIIDGIDNLILKLLAGFVILLPLMYFLYLFIGRYYKKKEGRKDV